MLHASLGLQPKALISDCVPSLVHRSLSGSASSEKTVYGFMEASKPLLSQGKDLHAGCHILYFWPRLPDPLSCSHSMPPLPISSPSNFVSPGPEDRIRASTEVDCPAQKGEQCGEACHPSVK